MVNEKLELGLSWMFWSMFCTRTLLSELWQCLFVSAEEKCSEWCIQCIRYLTDRVHDVSLKHCQIFCVFDRVIKHFLLYGTHIRVSSMKFHWIFTFDEEYDGLKCTHGVLLHIRTFENTTYHFITFVSYNFTVYWLHIQLLHHIRNY